jgi:hypothetical protein
MILLGADYEKVEALAAMQFEAIAMREQQHRAPEEGAGNAVRVSLEYARSYLRKIVNLRLNLRLPAAAEFKRLLQEPSLRPAGEKSLRRATVAAAIVATLVGATWTADALSDWGKPRATAAIESNGRTTSRTPATRPGDRGTEDDEEESRESYIVRHTFTSDQIVAAGENLWLWLFGPPLVVLAAGIMFWRSQPKELEQARDAASFGEALEQRVEEICGRSGSPREVRRFLNYLRLVATGQDTESPEDITGLRRKYGAVVDRHLVDLATTGRAVGSGAEAAAVEHYYRVQCELFGLDPQTFAPVERGPGAPKVQEAAEAAQTGSG